MFDLMSELLLNLPHYAICLIVLELARRLFWVLLLRVQILLNKASNDQHLQRVRATDVGQYFFEDVTKDRRWILAAFSFTVLYIGSLSFKKALSDEGDGDDSIDDPANLLLTCVLVLVGYTLIHPIVIMSPKARREKLKHDYHNIGPGEAKSFASIIKVGLKARKDRGWEKALKDYMRTEEIGMNGLSDFMTSKLVFLFPANLVKYAETFEKIRKESLKKRHNEDNRQWISVNSQGIVNLDKWVRSLKGEDNKLETGKELTVEYEMSGASRKWTCNVINWTDKRNRKDPKTWYFLTFDNKPLEHILEWYNHNKGVLSPSEIQRQVELYRECLREELDSDSDCKGQYYFLDFGGLINNGSMQQEPSYCDLEMPDTLSDSMLSLIRDIQNTEKRLIE